MKHIEIIKASKNENIDPMIATLTSNNFGDQIIEFRTYGICEKKDNLTFWGYVTQSTIINSENNHWSNAYIVKYGKELYKKIKV